MDNASKALIMAGAILIAIAIVGVGVYIFSSTSSVTETGRAQLDASAAQLANSTLRQYVGRIRGTTVKELLGYCANLNANNVYPQPIRLDATAVATDSHVSDIGLNGNYSAFLDYKYYNVTLGDELPKDAGDGYYDLVIVTNAN